MNSSVEHNMQTQSPDAYARISLRNVVEQQAAVIARLQRDLNAARRQDAPLEQPTRATRSLGELLLVANVALSFLGAFAAAAAQSWPATAIMCLINLTCAAWLACVEHTR